MSLGGWMVLGWLVVVAAALCLLCVGKGDPKPPEARLVKRRVRCPRCGRLAIKSIQRDGSVDYIHKQTTLARPFPHTLIEDSCHVRCGDPKPPQRDVTQGEGR